MDTIFGRYETVRVKIAESDGVVFGQICVGKIVACANANVKMLGREMLLEERKLNSAGRSTPKVGAGDSEHPKVVEGSEDKRK